MKTHLSMMRASRVRAWVAILLLACVAAGPEFIKPEEVGWEKVLTGPPAAGSDTEKSELAKILEWQNKRTPTDVARCKSEVNADAFIFADVLGDKFVEKDLPVTAKLLKSVRDDIRNVTAQSKGKWARKRPAETDDRVHPCVDPEATASYPSAHATRGVVWSRILARLFPTKKDQLLARGLLMGQDRVIAGMHYPSDVEAGQKLGNAIADKLFEIPKFQEALNEAKTECDKAEIVK